MEYCESHSFTLSIMGVITSLVFLILPRFPQYLIYMLNETLSLLGSLYFSTIVYFEGGSSPLPLKLFVPPFCSLTKNPKTLFPPPVKEKNTMKQIVSEITKVNKPNFLKYRKTTQVSWGNGFKNHLLSIKQ